jgi:UDP-glucose:(heptosyl)LPS alpha-1,3-glucosyltransferase
MKHSIALIKRAFSPHKGGLEKYSRRLAEAFSDQGHTVTILTTGRAPTFSCNNIEVCSLMPRHSSSWLHQLSFERKCRRWIKENDPSIVFGMDRSTHVSHYRAGEGVHAAYLQQRHHDASWLQRLSFAFTPRHRVPLYIEKAMYTSSKVECFFANSNMVRNEMIRHYGVPSKKISVVHNGVEWHEYKEHFESWHEKRPQLLQEHGLSPDDYHFVFIGSGFKRKGLTNLLHGLAMLKGFPWSLSVAGRDKSTKKYKHLAEKLGIASRVRFCGLCDDVTTLYQIADALVIPSLYDPFANVTVEALAMGLYVVTSQHNGGSEIITEENGAIIDDIWSPKSVCQALQRAIHHRKTLPSSHVIRETVQHLDFSSQLHHIVTQTIEGVS